MSNTIVVGVDASETAFAAAERASMLARSLGARLHVVSAFDREDREVVRVGGDEFVVSNADEAAALAASVAARVGAGVAEVTSGSSVGKPHEALVAEAERVEASLIVVGNRRVQGITRVLGSVAASVAQHAPCDVYIVKTV